MKRVLRIALNIATAMSILLLVAMLWLWLRSGGHCDEAYHEIEIVIPPTADSMKRLASYRTYLTSDRGRLRICRMVEPPREIWDGPDATSVSQGIGIATTRPRYPAAFEAIGIDLDREPDWSFAGGEWIGGSFQQPLFNYWQLIVPHWWIALLGALLPAGRAALWIRRGRRPRRGFCAVCGYDLRATPERCPECGTKPGTR